MALTQFYHARRHALEQSSYKGTSAMARLMDCWSGTQEPNAEVFSRPVYSTVLDAPSGRACLAVGDAASTYDPVSSQGLIKALSNGINAAEQIDQQRQGDNEALLRYGTTIQQSFQEYASIRDSYYSRAKNSSDSVASPSQF